MSTQPNPPVNERTKVPQMKAYVETIREILVRRLRYLIIDLEKVYLDENKGLELFYKEMSKEYPWLTIPGESTEGLCSTPRTVMERTKSIFLLMEKFCYVRRSKSAGKETVCALGYAVCCTQMLPGSPDDPVCTSCAYTRNDTICCFLDKSEYSEGDIAKLKESHKADEARANPNPEFRTKETELLAMLDGLAEYE
jgi:hypothetical protein